MMDDQTKSDSGKVPSGTSSDGSKELRDAVLEIAERRRRLLRGRSVDRMLRRKLSAR